MIHSILIITESLPVQPIAESLQSAAYSVTHVTMKEETAKYMAEVQAIVVAAPFASFSTIGRPLYERCDMPLFWWCGEQQSLPDAAAAITCDGLLFPTMNSQQIKWTFQVGATHYAQRLQFEQERRYLQLRLEERKWIDQAKRILCELKKFSEDEAYSFLRQQAMNERKKMVDVARSIVNVYRLIHDEPAKRGK
ncbi:ANTAR domain-containing protein [Brevibacillus humidisoli]|uniref:ANTAR domain-containing response regulator n=1 Tax=Brevibacillus humidisoli TaxID=2895522 RepID=UPI001E48C690|nr:ANTAR domain-containing protein [Brevibacillus humidisoli]UFJ39621.1 ANTAR domain-containing protein [Brevibacillus humidisoli]